MRLQFGLVAIGFLSVLYCMDCKPTLDEENRNLCEGAPDLEECLKEVEEADSMAQLTDSASSDKQEREDDGHHEMMMKQEAAIRKMVDETEQNRDYWDEEYKSINKWARHGIH